MIESSAPILDMMTVASGDDILVTARDCNTACPTEIYSTVRVNKFVETKQSSRAQFSL